MERLRIKEAVIVEGRDDSINVLRALDCLTIETHGFGIKKETTALIEKAYNEIGIIILTDPDYSGEEIRRKLAERFPDALHAYISRADATKKGDIGVENASPEAIKYAITKARKDKKERDINDNSFMFTIETLENAGLSSGDGAKARRETLGKLLGIGYGNTKSFLNKLNRFGITKEEFDETLSAIDNKRA